MSPYDVIVIGGGQAGLAAGHLLARQGLHFVILEAAGAPAAAWRGRWDSLRLFTPVRYQIAEELSATHEVHLSVGSRQAPLPQRVLGVDLFRILDRVGAMSKTADTRIGRRLKDGDTLVGSSPRKARRQPRARRPKRRLIGNGRPPRVCSLAGPVFHVSRNHLRRSGL